MDYFLKTNILNVFLSIKYEVVEEDWPILPLLQRVFSIYT